MQTIILNISQNNSKRYIFLDDSKVAEFDSIERLISENRKEILGKKSTILIVGNAISSRSMADSANLKSQVVLGANPNDFYFSIEQRADNTPIIHFTRKEVIDPFLKELDTHKGLFFSTVILTDLNNKESNLGSQLSSVIFQSPEIPSLTFQKNWPELLIAESLNCIELSESNERFREFKGYLNKRLVIRIALPIMLAIILFSIVAYFKSKEHYHSIQYMSSDVKSDYDQLEMIKANNAEQITVLKYLGLNRKKPIVYYLDQIAYTKSMVEGNGFILHKMNIFNAKDTSRNMENNQIRIFGQMQNSSDLTSFIELLEKKTWVKKSIINYISRHEELPINGFQLTLLINE